MAVSTSNGLVNGPVHDLLMQFFTLGSSKIEVFETCFFDIVTTQNDHRRYAKHVLGLISVFFRPLVVHLHVVRLFQPSHNHHVPALEGPSRRGCCPGHKPLPLRLRRPLRWVGLARHDVFPWGAWPRDAAVDTHKQAGRQSTALTGASLRSCHVRKRFRILASLKQGNESMYSNTSGYVHIGVRLDWGKGITGQ